VEWIHLAQQGLLVGSCESGDEPSRAGATELLRFIWRKPPAAPGNMAVKLKFPLAAWAQY
jgi:hypothetical protein